ncbi:hypothetical protein BS78_02G049700 [Paspalum vaginatum]|nr:hypothetical protein BS78_02G049700 [Paspalum vaginatum]
MKGTASRSSPLWGSGGLGKTTLAMEVCRRLEAHFQCQVMVSVSQAFEPCRDLNPLLKCMPSQVVTAKSDTGEAIKEEGACVKPTAWMTVIWPETLRSFSKTRDDVVVAGDRSGGGDVEGGKSGGQGDGAGCSGGRAPSGASLASGVRLRKQTILCPRSSSGQCYLLNLVLQGCGSEMVMQDSKDGHAELSFGRI